MVLKNNFTCYLVMKITQLSTTTFRGVIYKEFLYSFKLEDIRRIQNWKYNRPPNIQKVNEIVETIKDGSHTPTPLLGYITVSDSSIKEVHVYDGGHRLSAYKLMADNDNLTSILCGKVFIQVCVNPPFEYIKNKFKMINKLTPVSELYTDMNDPQEMLRYQKTIDELGNAFQKVYNKNTSTANNPHSPNYNKYHFQEDIRVLSIEHESLRSMETNEIISIFDKLNKYYQSIYTEKYAEYSAKMKKCIDKARKVECFLFVQGRTKWKDDIIKYI